MDIIDDLKSEAKFTPQESQVFKDLQASGAYAIAIDAMSRMVLTCGDMALDDGRSEYWSGVRDGLSLFFQLTDSEALTAKYLIAEIRDRDIEIDNSARGDAEVALSQAISSLGSRPL